LHIGNTGGGKDDEDDKDDENDDTRLAHQVGCEAAGAHLRETDCVIEVRQETDKE
jgi:hypothetical protein